MYVGGWAELPSWHSLKGCVTVGQAPTHLSLKTMLLCGLPGSMRVSSVSGSPGRRMTGRWMGRMSSWKADSILQVRAQGRQVEGKDGVRQSRRRVNAWVDKQRTSMGATGCAGAWLQPPAHAGAARAQGRRAGLLTVPRRAAPCT